MVIFIQSSSSFDASDELQYRFLRTIQRATVASFCLQRFQFPIEVFCTNKNGTRKGAVFM